MIFMPDLDIRAMVLFLYSNNQQIHLSTWLQTIIG